MGTPVEIGTPVISSRQWTTALAPRDGGGWNFITQSYQHPNIEPTEWVVVHLEDGTYTIDEELDGVYSNTNYQIPSANTSVTTNNQLRASNGRIFFAERGSDTDANIAYYDPSDERVHQLPPLSVGPHDVQLVYSSVFDHAGDWLYFGTQADGTGAPSVFRVNVATLAMEAIGVVGDIDPGFPRYAYYLAKDEGTGSDLLYVAVGQHGWQLIQIEISTGIATELYATSGPGLQFMQFGNQVEGVSVQIIDNGVSTHYWLADGVLSDGSLPEPPSGARNTIPYVNPLVSPPEIDWSRGIGQVLWRPFESEGAWTLNEYTVTYRSPVPIESLTVLEDGSVFGNAEQYQGFFNDLTWYGAWTTGVSRPALAVVGSLVYIAGYPNGVLYVYDTEAEWAPDGTDAGNPSLLGTFDDSGMKYAYFLEQSSNGYLYCCGRLERDDEGASIGTFNLESQEFGPVMTSGLADYDPRGFVVLDDVDRVVFSGELNLSSVLTEAEIVVYDRAFVELGRYQVAPGMTNTGVLYETSDPGVVIGLSGTTIYRFNVLTGTVLASVTADDTIGSSAARADLTIWAMIGDTLCRIDSETLAITERDTIEDVTGMSWSGTTLVFVTTDTLWRLAFIDAIDPNILRPTAEAGHAALPLEFYDVLIEHINECATVVGVAEMDPDILTPGSSIQASVPEFLLLALAKINEIIEEGELDIEQIDPASMTPSAIDGATDTVPEFHDVLIERINAVINTI